LYKGMPVKFGGRDCWKYTCISQKDSTVVAVESGKFSG
jgi:hypothetical protein